MRAAACVLAIAAWSPVAAQTLEARVSAVRDGDVQFTYATRRPVCANRDDLWFGRVQFGTHNSGYGYISSPCRSGVFHVVVARENGSTQWLQLRVDRAPVATGAHDLGVVPASEAAHFLLAIAPSLSGRSAADAVTAAAIADSINLGPELSRIARASNFGRETRERAIFMLASYDDAVAHTALRELAGDPSLEDTYRGAAMIAMTGEDGIDRDDARFLQAIYPKASEKLKDHIFLALSRSGDPKVSEWMLAVVANPAESMHVRQQALFWAAQGDTPTPRLASAYDGLADPQLKRHFTFVLSQRRDAAALDKLIDIAEKDPDRETRKQAMFWLGQSHDPRATQFLRDMVTR